MAKTANMILLIILAAGVILGVGQVHREWLVAKSQIARERGYGRADLLPLAGNRLLPPRAALNIALALAKASQREEDPAERARTLAAAHAILSRAKHARLYWSEASVVAAYISLLQHGPDDPRTRRAYARSFEEAGFLRDAADWRIYYGARQWSSLSMKTRASMLNEAIWIAQMSKSDALRVRSLLVNAQARGELDRALPR